MTMTFKIIAGLLVFGWAMSLAWVFGMWLAHVRAEHRNVRRRRAIVAERADIERRIAQDFGEWEREQIAWQRDSCQRHPSRENE